MSRVVACGKTDELADGHTDMKLIFAFCSFASASESFCDRRNQVTYLILSVFYLGTTKFWTAITFHTPTRAFTHAHTHTHTRHTTDLTPTGKLKMMTATCWVNRNSTPKTYRKWWRGGGLPVSNGCYSRPCIITCDCWNITHSETQNKTYSIMGKTVNMEMFFMKTNAQETQTKHRFKYM